VQHSGVRTTRTHVPQSRPISAVQKPSVHSSLGMVVFVADVVADVEDISGARAVGVVVLSDGADE
jgi:hypothetical protein